MKILTKRNSSALVPIVPMIDILTILLIFFIAHTQWKTTTSVVDVDIPQVVNLPGTRDVAPRESLRVSATGEISLMGKLIPLEKLSSHLKTLKENNPTLKFDLEADRKLPLETLMQVWTSMSEAGYPIKDSSVRIKKKSAN